jgi:predicted transcriptional regulator
MDTDTDLNLGEAVKKAILESDLGSVRAVAIEAAIPYTTLDRRLRDGDFTVAQLRRIAAVTGHNPSEWVRG